MVHFTLRFLGAGTLGTAIAIAAPGVTEERWNLTSSPGSDASPHGLAELSLKAAQLEHPALLHLGLLLPCSLETHPPALVCLALPAVLGMENTTATAQHKVVWQLHIFKAVMVGLTLLPAKSATKPFVMTLKTMLEISQRQKFSLVKSQWQSNLPDILDSSETSLGATKKSLHTLHTDFLFAKPVRTPVRAPHI